MTVAQASSYKDCALGKWLYSSGLEEFGDVPEMQQLENLHQRFHEAVRKVISSKASGDTARSEQELARVESLSEQIVSLLTALEQQTQAAAPPTSSFYRRMIASLVWSLMKSMTRRKSSSSRWANNSKASPPSRERPSWEMAGWH